MLSGHAAKWKGWRSRGHRFAASVSANGWKSFDKQLKIAKDHYLKALEIDPDRPEPAVALAGSPYPQSEALKYYRIAAQIEADNQSAAVGLLNCFRPRWGGSADMSYEFAEKCYESPLTGTKLKEYGLWALVNGAYECRDQRAWQRGVRAMPKINNVVKYLRDKVPKRI